jgi:hypothetical protein
VTPAVVERFAAECGVTLRPGAARAIAALMAPDPGPPYPVGTVLVSGAAGRAPVWVRAAADDGSDDWVEVTPGLLETFGWVDWSHIPPEHLVLRRGPDVVS